jgi:hypothetical protein
MKRITAVLLLLVFSNLAVAHPFASGGGSESPSEETDITLIILVVVVAGVGALLVSDILSDNDENSGNTFPDEEDVVLTEETGVNWNDLGSNGEVEPLPLLAVSVFPEENGKDLADYFSSLINQGDMLYYQVYPSPVSFGTMEPSEAARTGFSFLDCQWFITADSSGLMLYTETEESPAWFFNPVSWDSTTVREASSSFLQFAMGLDN